MNQSKQRKKNNSTAYLWLLLCLAIVVAGVLLIVPRTKDRNDLSQPKAWNIPFTRQGSLFFIGQAAPDTLATIGIEIADDDNKRARGLMYRQSLPEDAGMLFLHREEQIQSFWMKNTYIPLDMIFVNGEKRIVTIHAQTRPLKEWSYASTEPALYVVEVNGGFCSRHHIGVGDKIDFIFDK